MRSCIVFLLLTLVGLLPFETVPLFAQDAQSGHGNPEHWHGRAPSRRGIPDVPLVPG